MKTGILLFLPIFSFMCLSLVSSKVDAVVPPPDGGYSGFNTAEGQNALFSLDTTAGLANTAIGWFSLKSNVNNSFSTGVGAGALVLNTADENTAVGAAALLFNTTGTRNTAVGAAALLHNDDGSYNMANGVDALFSNTTGDFNTAIGERALFSNTEGNANNAIGNAALSHNTTGSGNTAIGHLALLANTTGEGNTAIGPVALEHSTTGFNNTAVGTGALANVTTGSGNIALGQDAGSAMTTNSDVICIGAPGPATVSDACFIGHIFGLTSSGGTAVFINSDGRLGTQVSSRRFKEEIKLMERASEALYALKPVTFHYKKEFDPEAVPQFGLVAEDVEAVNPDLVVRDKNGKVNTVRYDAINTMLLNEFLKEHKAFLEEQQKVKEQARRMREQEATIAQLKKEVEAVVAHAKEQDARIQSVSEQIENANPETHLVTTD